MKTKTPKKKVTLETLASLIVGVDKKLSRKIDDKIDELAISTANGFRDLEIRLTKKIDVVDIRVSGVDTRLDFVEKKVDHLDKKITGVETNLGKKIDGLDMKINDLNFHKVRDDVFFLGKRMDKIESKVGMKE
jgi:hypothetical protein